MTAVRGRRRSLRLVAGAALAIVGLVVAVLAFRERRDRAALLTAAAVLGDVRVVLSESGVLRPAESITYRSPLAGREAELTFLIPEGSTVQEGDLLASLDATELEREFERATALARQADLSVTTAEAERQDAAAEIESVSNGERALEVDEARAKLATAEREAARLNEAFAGHANLYTRGFISRDEFERATRERDQGQTDLGLLRRRLELLTERSRPREAQKARVQLAQRESHSLRRGSRPRKSMPLWPRCGNSSRGAASLPSAGGLSSTRNCWVRCRSARFAWETELQPPRDL